MMLAFEAVAEPQKLGRADARTAAGRGGKAVYLLMTYGPMTTKELARALGYQDWRSVHGLFELLSLMVPIYYDEPSKKFGILHNE